jgi:hypothetical protein
MTLFNYPSSEIIINQIIKHIESIRLNNVSSPFFPAPPNSDELKNLLDCIFAASLETEENRIVAFTVSYFHDQEISLPYLIKPSIPLSARDIARLAVALDPSRSRICVVPGDTGLEIAGLIHLGEQEAFHGSRRTLNNLSIRVLGPAVFLVRYYDKLLFTYLRGRFAFHFGENSRLNEYDVKHALSFRFATGRTTQQIEVDYRFEAAIQTIARTMQRLRHGGTLLVLPEGTNWENAVTSKRYAPSSPVTIVKEAYSQHFTHIARKDACVQSLAQGVVTPDTLAYFADDLLRSQFSYELEWLARLTATDGMTVILPDYTLLGFGVFFDTKEDKENPTLIITIDPYDEEMQSTPMKLDTLGGARHQSAAVTCKRFPGSFAIVASQDGSLSSMQLDDATGVVVVFRHVQLLLAV